MWEMKHLNIEKVTAIQLVLVFYDVGSLAASTESTTAATTSSPGSPFYVLTAPWGDNQTQSIQLACDIDIPEDIGPGDLIVLLSLNRSTTNVDPHTLDLVQSLPDGLRFTFTNAWVIPSGPFVFDFELSYSVDGNETYVPGGYCSKTSVNETTTSVTTTVATTTTTTPTIPTTTVSTTPATTTTIVTSTIFTSQTTTTVSMTATSVPITTAPSALTATTTQTTTSTSSSSNEGEASRGNIFTNVRYGDLVSVVLVASLSFGGLVILGMCRCCLYKHAFRRGAVGSEEDNASASRNTSPVSGLQPSSPVSTSSVTSLIFV